MQLGTFKIPEIRLDIILSETLDKIYKSVKTEEIQSKDISVLLGYTHGTERGLFQKINSMLVYGVLEGRGVYNITKLGEDLLFPEPDKKQSLTTKAIMNVKLWKELFAINEKELPNEGLWIQLKNIAEVDPPTAKKLEKKIFNWYNEDMKFVSNYVIIEENTEQNSEPQTIRSRSAPNKPEIDDGNMEIISFDKYTITLPKGNIKAEWEKLKKYMEIKLEDYKYEEPKSVETMGFESITGINVTSLEKDDIIAFSDESFEHEIKAIKNKTN